MVYDMNVLVFSDTHGHIDECIQIIRQTECASALIHAGDHVDDAKELADTFKNIPCLCVSGNNDLFSREPNDKLVVLGGKNVFITHGHLYGVRQSRQTLAHHAKSLGAELVIYGHTHQPCDEYINGIHVINPGTMGFYPRTYASLCIEDDKISTKIIRL